MNGPWHSYLYAVGRDGGDLDAVTTTLTGLRGAPLRTVADGGLAALVSSVPADDFGPDGITERMAGQAELEVLARTHHEVVEAAHARAAVLPMRLATVYLDDARVRAMLAERAPEFRDVLSWLGGHAELGVKVYADPGGAAWEDVAPAPRRPDRAVRTCGSAGSSGACATRRTARPGPWRARSATPWPP